MLEGKFRTKTCSTRAAGSLLYPFLLHVSSFLSRVPLPLFVLLPRNTRYSLPMLGYFIVLSTRAGWTFQEHVEPSRSPSSLAFLYCPQCVTILPDKICPLVDGCLPLCPLIKLMREILSGACKQHVHLDSQLRRALLLSH